MLQSISQHPARCVRTLAGSLLTVLALIIIQPALTIAAKAEEKTINLIDKDGTPLEIGKITFSEADKGKSFTIKWNDKPFSEHFLSMRPFRCIDGEQTICHLAYPYKTRKQITDDNLMDLEYEFLFLHKGKGEYGINFWNGVYYRLTRQDDGSFTGEVWETDMNELASPPDEEYGRPIGNDDLTLGAKGKHRFPRLEIK